MRLDVDVDAYLPADYIPFEAAKIDVHRRLAGAREPGELRALRDELRDRFGPLPEPVESLFELQRARIELGRLGARTVEFRGERLSVTPLELDAAAVGRLRERIPEAIYESRVKTLSLRVPDEPEARLAAVLELTEAVAEASDEVAVAARACRVGRALARRKRRRRRGFRRSHGARRRLRAVSRPYAADLVPVPKDRRIVVGRGPGRRSWSCCSWWWRSPRGSATRACPRATSRWSRTRRTARSPRRSSSRRWSRRPPAQGAKEVPAPSDPQYAALRDSAMSDLLLGRWVRGEASERGITVSDSEISNRLDQIIEQDFGGQKQFEQYLKQAHFTAGAGARAGRASAARATRSRSRSSLQDAGRLGLRDRGLLRGQHGPVRAAGDP